MEINVSKKDIQQILDVQVKAAIMKGLGKNKDVVIAEIVNKALSQKKNNYDRTTIFEDAIDEMIRKAAKETLMIWLESKKEIIKQAIVKRLNKEESDFLESIADQIVNGLAKSFYVTCRLKVGEED